MHLSRNIPNWMSISDSLIPCSPIAWTSLSADSALDSSLLISVGDLLSRLWSVWAEPLLVRSQSKWTLIQYDTLSPFDPGGSFVVKSLLNYTQLDIIAHTFSICSSSILCRASVNSVVSDDWFPSIPDPCDCNCSCFSCSFNRTCTCTECVTDFFDCMILTEISTWDCSVPPHKQLSCIQVSKFVIEYWCTVTPQIPIHGKNTNQHKFEG